MIFSRVWYFLFHWTDDCQLHTRPETLCRYNTQCALFHKMWRAKSFGLCTGGTSGAPLAPQCLNLVSGYLPSPPYLQCQWETWTTTVLGIFLYAVHMFKMLNNKKKLSPTSTIFCTPLSPHPPGPDIFLSTLSSNALSPCFSINMNEQVLHP